MPVAAARSNAPPTERGANVALVTLAKARTEAKNAVEALVAAVHGLRYEDTKRPASDELRMVWPDLGRAWIAEWAHELGRDLVTVGGDLERAFPGATEDEALTALENALWRLGAAREKFYAVVALAFGIPSLLIGDDKEQTLSFRPKVETCRKKLRELQGLHEPARRILNLDGTLRQSLLLRHQATHSLAPLIKSHSLTWYEAALIERGGVQHYLAFHLPPKGLEQLDDIGAEALRQRAQTLVERGFGALVAATAELAALLVVAAELEPPPIIWKAMETNECFYTRDEASARSAEAAPAADTS
jgi:hypothetical protein